jgi:hypothetical protein
MNKNKPIKQTIMQYDTHTCHLGVSPLDEFGARFKQLINRVKRHVFFLKMIIAQCLLFLSVVSHALVAQDASLKVHYRFDSVFHSDSIADVSGNGFNARLKGGAFVKSVDNEGFLHTGSLNGYLDMGIKMGDLIQSLNDFSVATYVYIDASLDLSRNGNFIWCFSNAEDILATPIGCMFYSAKVSQYAISPTNWTGEQKLGLGIQSVKGRWMHVAYVQSELLGSLYIDGVLAKSGSVTMLPANLGKTLFNYLARSSYSQDQYLKNSIYNDFRVYNRALSGAEVGGLASQLSRLDDIVYGQLVHEAKEQLDLGDLNALTRDVSLPSIGKNGTSILWHSSNDAIVGADGRVTRPAYGSNAVNVQLIATITLGTASDTKSFDAWVLPAFSDAESVFADAANLTLSGRLNQLRSDLVLPTAGSEGSSIVWHSNNEAVLSSTGKIIDRPLHGQGDIVVMLTATIVKGSESQQKTFQVTVAEDEGFVGYLFSYFTGNYGDQEAIRFATSNDGFVYRALNENRPIIASSLISSTGGVRDPHILRGHDGEFYMVVTDMVSANGWASNRAMVLLKSSDLINWSSAIVNIPQTYSAFTAVDRVWAPQTIYDALAGKYMVYFSMRMGPSDTDKIYYAYANSNFTAFESAPQLLFENPGVASIDGDIVYDDVFFHLFFKTEGAGAGIKKATSTKLTGPYHIHDAYLQQTTLPVEGGCVFRLTNSDSWILMYDLYTAGAYQLTESTDLLNFAVVSQPFSFDFSPRHGTVIPITQLELNALNAKWNVTQTQFTLSRNGIQIHQVPGTRRQQVIVDGDIHSGALLSIYQMNGLMVLSMPVTKPHFQIDGETLSSGVYVLKFQNGNGFMQSVRLFVK